MCHSPCATLPDHVTMSRQERFTREQVLQQLFSQQPSSEPEADAKEPDQEDGADGEADTDDGDYEDDDSGEDYDPVGDASADSSFLEEEE